MGFRFRKSINLGMGFRINMSKSGPGFSWGGKGFRLTKTAKGNIRGTAYIPGTGLSYQKEFKNPLASGLEKVSETKESPRIEKSIKEQTYENTRSYKVDFTQIHSTALEEIIQASKAKRPYRLMGLILSIGGIFLFFINHYLIFLTLIGAILYFYKQESDDINIDYDFTEASQKEYDLTQKLLAGILESDQVFFIDRLGEDGDKFVILERRPIKISNKLPGKISTNVEVTSLRSNDMGLSFLPDALLFDKNGSYKAVSYEDMDVDLRSDEFYESGEVANDASIIGKTYLHTNKNGEPDKRYKENPEITLVEYGILEMKNSDFDFMIGFSDTIIDGK